MQDSQSNGSTKTSTASRRRFFAGAATAGAVAATVAVMPRIVQAPAELEAAPVLPAAPANGGGYSLSENVKRF